MKPIQPQGEASPHGAMLAAEAAKPSSSSGQNEREALPADLPALLLQAVEALEMAREYVNAEFMARSNLYAAYPHKWASERDDLSRIDEVAAALRQRIGRE